MNLNSLLKNKFIKPVFIIFIVILFPLIFNTPMNMKILVEIAIFSIIVLGLNMLMGLAGQISMGHAGLFGLSAYITGLLSSGKITQLQLPTFLSIPIAIVITTLISFIIAYPILKLKGHYLAMGTLSLGIIFYTIFINLPFSGGFDGFAGIPRLWIFGEHLTKDVFKITKYLNGYIIATSILLILLWFTNNLEKSKIGRALKALHTSETAASTLGIDVTRYKVLVFTISGFYASIGGVLFAHFYCGVTPGDFSVIKSITLVTMLVIGGSSSMWGSVLGAAFLIFINYFLEFFQGIIGKFGLKVNFGDMNILIYGLLFIIILIFLPDGLVGLRQKLKKQEKNNAHS